MTKSRIIEFCSASVAMMILSCCLGGPCEISLQTNSETIPRANLTALDSATVTVERIGDKEFPEEVFPIESVKTIQLVNFAENSVPASSECKIHFWDESYCFVQEFGLTAENFTFSISSAEITSNCNRYDIRSILLDFAGYAQITDSAKQWDHLQMESKKSASDILVVRRDGNLLHYEGLIVSIDENRILFEHEGEILKLKKAKVFGLIFAKKSSETDMRELVAEITGPNGRIWATNLELKMVQSDCFLHIVSISGVDFQWKMSEVRSIDFASGNVTALVSVQPILYEYSPYFAQGNILKPAIYVPFEMDGEKIAQGMLLKSKTQVVYVIPKGAKEFRAKIGIVDSVRPYGDAKVRILLDEKEIYTEGIQGNQPAKTIICPLNDAKKMTIWVDYAGAMDFSDSVGFADANFLK